MHMTLASLLVYQRSFPIYPHKYIPYIPILLEKYVIFTTYSVSRKRLPFEDKPQFRMFEFEWLTVTPE